MKLSDFPTDSQMSWLAFGNGTVPSEFITVFKIMEKVGLLGKNKGVVYDIGACVGHFTHKISLFFPGIQVIGFEAFTHHKPVHDFFGWNTHFIGLSDVNDTKTFYSADTEGSGNSYYQENEAITNMLYDKTTDIKCYRLDDYIESNNLPLPDFIKIDVQGAERDVLAGGIKALNHSKAILIEVQLVEYNKGAPPVDEIITILTENGYSKYIIVKSDDVQADFLFMKDEICENL